MRVGRWGHSGAIHYLISNFMMGREDRHRRRHMAPPFYTLIAAAMFVAVLPLVFFSGVSCFFSPLLQVSVLVLALTNNITLSDVSVSVRFAIYAI